MVNQRGGLGSISGGQGRSWRRRLLLVGLVGFAFALMMLAKADTILVERMRTTVSDLIAPLLEVLARPANSITDAIDVGRSVMTQQEELARLREDNARLIKWQRVAEQLERENRSLRDLLRFAVDPAPQVVWAAARVIGDQSSSFSRSFLINAGRNHGIRQGQAVATGDSLIGRIAEVGARSARVLLVTDIQSRIPVLVESTRVRAVLRGNNEDQPFLVHLAETATVEVGERIVTSGHGGSLPAGLPVGIVSDAGKDGGRIRVKLASDLHRVEVVRVIDFGLQSVFDLKYQAGEDAGTSGSRRN